MYSKSINVLIESFKKLPSVGQKTAERFVFHLLKSGKKETSELILAIKQIINNVKSCEICGNFSDSNLCHIDADKTRDKNLICVVIDPQDVAVIERINEFRGVYHVLRDGLDMEANSDLKNIRIKELLTRLSPATRIRIREIVLALNPDLTGETTMMYLTREIQKINPAVKITRLARGLPMGSDLQYADEITLASALKNRK